MIRQRTVKPLKVPSCLVVSPSDAMFADLRRAAIQAQVLLAQCTLEELNNTAAQMRPLVLAVSAERYHSNPAQYDELARDLRSTVLAIDPAPDAAALAQALKDSITRAESLRPSWSVPDSQRP